MILARMSHSERRPRGGDRNEAADSGPKKKGWRVGANGDRIGAIPPPIGKITD
jgi:hypothetical protein